MAKKLPDVNQRLLHAPGEAVKQFHPAGVSDLLIGFQDPVGMFDNPPGADTRCGTSQRMSRALELLKGCSRHPLHVHRRVFKKQAQEPLFKPTIAHGEVGQMLVVDGNAEVCSGAIEVQEPVIANPHRHHALQATGSPTHLLLLSHVPTAEWITAFAAVGTSSFITA
jgi:hypothetical protein